MTRRTGWLAALLGTAIAASSWLVYRPERVRPRRSKSAEINRLIDPILARAARDADADGTEYTATWGPRRVA